MWALNRSYSLKEEVTGPHYEHLAELRTKAFHSSSIKIGITFKWKNLLWYTLQSVVITLVACPWLMTEIQLLNFLRTSIPLTLKKVQVTLVKSKLGIGTAICDYIIGLVAMKYEICEAAIMVHLWVPTMELANIKA